MVKITKDGEQVLRDIAESIPLCDIKSLKIKKMIEDMSEALSKEKFGVAIAAPQIGISLQMFIIAGKVFSKRKGKAASTDTAEPNQIFINPKIIKTSKKKQESHESCLSIQGRPAERGPDVAGIVERPDKMTIGYYDEDGEKREKGASGFLAAIFDHEIDHLNGVLFIDKTIEDWEIDSNFNKVS